MNVRMYLLLFYSASGFLFLAYYKSLQIHYTSFIVLCLNVDMYFSSAQSNK